MKALIAKWSEYACTLAVLMVSATAPTLADTAAEPERCESAAPPARFGRIDVYSVDGAFDVRDVRVSPGAQVLDVGWRGEGMADTGATAQARAREMWRELWIEVVPGQLAARSVRRPQIAVVARTST
jgi:hypothetical protein